MTKSKPKSRRVQSKPFTEIEDYFLVGRSGEWPLSTIAEKLGRSLLEIEHRAVELGLDPTALASRLAENKRANALQGYGIKMNERTGEVQSVVMTDGRSMLDDRLSGVTPKELGGQGRPSSADPYEKFRHR